MSVWTSRQSWTAWVLLGASGLILSGCPAGPPQGPDPVLFADPADDDGGASGAQSGDFDRGVAFIKRDAFAEAIAHFDKVLETDPKNAQAEYYRAVAKERLGERDAALKGYERALELDPKLVDAAVNLGAMFLDEDPKAGIEPQPAQAIAVLSKAAEQVPDDPGVQENLAFAYRLSQNWEKAGKHYEQALKLGDSARTRFAYGDMLYEAKRCEQAAVHLEKAIDGFGEDLRVLATLADLLARCKAYRGCVKALNGANKLQPSEPQWLVRRGVCHHGLKDETKARSDYQAALKQDPKFAAAYYYLGMSYRAEMKRTQAVHAFEQASRLDRKGPIGKKAKAALKDMKR